jgi:hypothetical protein
VGALWVARVSSGAEGAVAARQASTQPTDDGAALDAPGSTTDAVRGRRHVQHVSQVELCDVKIHDRRRLGDVPLVELTLDLIAARSPHSGACRVPSIIKASPPPGDWLPRLSNNKAPGLAEFYARHWSAMPASTVRSCSLVRGTGLALRVHDLRGFFLTYALANVTTETWVMDRTGHTSSVMVNRYRRVARTVAEAGLGSPMPLHAAIPELLPRSRQPLRQQTSRKSSKEACKL